MIKEGLLAFVLFWRNCEKRRNSHCHFKYSKALRCTFFGERKKSCSSKFVQLLLLNRAKARWSKKRAAQGFHNINSFISNFFGPNSKTCTCEVRAAQDRVSRGLTVFTKNYKRVCSYSDKKEKRIDKTSKPV